MKLLAGNYVNGVLSGVGRIHMNDDSVREGWFLNGLAEGAFRGTVKVNHAYKEFTSYCNLNL